ncbi:ribonuclease P protein component [Catalinimonas alkaloidigena]|uniref:ribonuclease P protein component n=1 Tax=Catalinimonas alkaloidigena TaxID=1075417 RepID=UPI002405C883|nr:ribonuclease P protein component [Catalinimonas alkaloidigena]MDF9800636.1 ribonuclease P protein component [Catalinimonas alkaloidigena]
MRHTLPRHERLSSKKLIADLFKRGKAHTHYPIRLIYLPVEELEHHQVLFTVPRRHFKKAVDRNRLKRQMREAYRQHKHLITYKSPGDVHFLLGYIYIARDKNSYQRIETKILESLYRLKK